MRMIIIGHLHVVCHILQKLLSRGSINQYVLGVSEPLGPLTFLRVWHDNSGKGKHASWFLDKVVITNLQTNDMWVIILDLVPWYEPLTAVIL